MARLYPCPPKLILEGFPPCAGFQVSGDRANRAAPQPVGLWPVLIVGSAGRRRPPIRSSSQPTEAGQSSPLALARESGAPPPSPRTGCPRLGLPALHAAAIVPWADQPAVIWSPTRARRGKVGPGSSEFSGTPGLFVVCPARKRVGAPTNPIPFGAWLCAALPTRDGAASGSALLALAEPGLALPGSGASPDFLGPAPRKSGTPEKAPVTSG